MWLKNNCRNSRIIMLNWLFIPIGLGILNLLFQTIKRVFDLTLCLLSLVITLPVFIIISIILWIDSPGPIFHIQERLGKNGRRFKLYKFRTMVVGAEKKLDEILERDTARRLEYEEFHKLQNDPTYTTG